MDQQQQARPMIEAISVERIKANIEQTHARGDDSKRISVTDRFRNSRVYSNNKVIEHNGQHTEDRRAHAVAAIVVPFGTTIALVPVRVTVPTVALLVGVTIVHAVVVRPALPAGTVESVL